MQISLDDGQSWQEVQQVRIVKKFDPVLDSDDEILNAELHFNFTAEGTVTDVWINNVCEGSASQTYLDIGDELVDS